MHYFLLLLLISCSRPDFQSLNKKRCDAVFSEKLTSLKNSGKVIVRDDDECVVNRFKEYSDVIIEHYNHYYYIEVKRW